jgi:hypothetical protein
MKLCPLFEKIENPYPSRGFPNEYDAALHGIAAANAALQEQQEAIRYALECMQDRESKYMRESECCAQESHEMWNQCLVKHRARRGQLRDLLTDEVKP